jgi:type II secretory pathway pseudopilin PulG
MNSSRQSNPLERGSASRSRLIGSTLLRVADPRSEKRHSALTLLEMMVAVTLLAVIMIGLLAMFQAVTRALQVAHAQSDVFENARGAIQLVARDLTEMTAYGDEGVINAYAVRVPSPIPGGALQLPSGVLQFASFNESFWLTRVNDDWRGVGYFVDGTNFGVGTLYRFSEPASRTSALNLRNRFINSVPTNRVSDGIVHFSMEAVYITNTSPPKLNQHLYLRRDNFQFPLDSSNTLPMFVDVELGVLEPATLKQFHSLTGVNVTAAQNFLKDHVGRIHFFRERVPIRNFINQYSANEVP